MRLYFAYGSNLNKMQMMRRCPDARVFERAKLRGWRLEFWQVLNIVADPNSVVEGALWYTSASDELALDRYEGFNPFNPRKGLYRKETVTVDLEDGLTCEAYVYVMNRGQQAPPNPHYLFTCMEGCHNFGISENVMLRALKPTVDPKMYGMLRGGWDKIARMLDGEEPEDVLRKLAR